MAFDYWFSWASQLQAGDQLWYQRCEGGHVQASVVETCPGSNACWVEYYVKRPQGGRQHRRALVKLDELARIQREHGELNSGDSSQEEEADANCALAWDDVEEPGTARQRAISMAVAESSEDDSVQLESPSEVNGERLQLPRRRALSMIFADEETFQRTRAFSMIEASEDEFSERDFQSRPRAISMLWSDDLDGIPEQSECESEHTELRRSDSDDVSARPEQSGGESSEDEQRDECKSGASQRSTASPESDSPVLGAYGEDDCLWPSAQWVLPELVGLEPGQVEVFCASSPDGCTNCLKPLVGHSVCKVEEELNDLCRILQMKVAFLEAEAADDELLSLEGDAQACVLEEDPEEEEHDPCKAFTPESVSEEVVKDPVGQQLVSDQTVTQPRPKKKAGLVARAWALLGCQSGAKAARQTPEGTGPDASMPADE